MDIKKLAWNNKFRIFSLILILLAIHNVLIILSLTEEEKHGIPSNACILDKGSRGCNILNATYIINDIGTIAAIVILIRLGWKFMNKYDEKQRKKQGLVDKLGEP